MDARDLDNPQGRKMLASLRRNLHRPECEECGERFTPRDSRQRLCPECEDPDSLVLPCSY
jgi:Zn finger protein HypA/HybF involved in hydrogenase expression